MTTSLTHHSDTPPRSDSPLRSAVRCRWRGALMDDSGAVTAEYAIVIMAAVGFAGLLLAVMRSPEVKALLLGLVTKALQVG